MSFEIDKPIKVAEKQILSFRSVEIISGQNGLEGHVSFSVKNENGEYLDPVRRSYYGADFNTFWTAFNSGTFLYTEIAEIKGEEIPEGVSFESDFLNS
jgi:hypothetical protein